MTKITKPEVRWNVRSTSDSDPERHHYALLVINGEREFDEIRAKLFGQVSPILEEEMRTKGKITGTGLQYRLLCFDAAKGPVNIKWKEIYQGKVTKDRKLVERETRDGLAIYVDQTYNGQQ